MQTPEGDKASVLDEITRAPTAALCDLFPLVNAGRVLFRHERGFAQEGHLHVCVMGIAVAVERPVAGDFSPLVPGGRLADAAHVFPG